MAISKETIQEFRDVVKEEYGEDMSLEDASESLRNIVGYFDLLHKIDTRDNPEKNERRD
jgi:Asp-tRNA(Asn)/Glu-tRNA(Gln) amidotransferase C subunit